MDTQPTSTRSRFVDCPTITPFELIVRLPSPKVRHLVSLSAYMPSSYSMAAAAEGAGSGNATATSSSDIPASTAHGSSALDRCISAPSLFLLSSSHLPLVELEKRVEELGTELLACRSPTSAADGGAASMPTAPGPSLTSPCAPVASLPPMQQLCRL